MIRARLRFPLALSLLLPALPALATNGYFAHGYGNNSKAQGGVAFALPQDTLVVASNPAGLALVGDRLDLGVDWFTPRRAATIKGNQLITGGSADGDYDGNGRKNFFIPEFGYSRRIDDIFTAGIAIYGNGGLNTEYANNPFAAFALPGDPKPDDASVDLSQLFVAPTLALKLGARQSVGISLNFVYQRFKATGLQPFATKGFPAGAPLIGPFSTEPDRVTNQEYDQSTGWGFRVGYLAEPIKGLTIGVGGSPKIHMQRFSRYSGLFAGHGAFDIPANFGGGISYRWRDRLVISSDIQRIYYSDVASVGNPLQPFTQGVKLGADDGPGFGWQDITVYKAGLGLRPVKWLLLETGYSYTRGPIRSDQTLFNILAPGTINRHYTFGALADLGNGYSLSAYYLWAPESTVHGQGSIPGRQGLNVLPPQNFGGGEADIRLKERALGIALGIAF